MGSGVPLIHALRIAGSVMTNLVLRDASSTVSIAVQGGSSLSRALSQELFFPPMMVHMVASGEASGDLEKMLERSALNPERELEMTLGTIMGLFEPAMVVLMGGLVLTIVLAILDNHEQTNRLCPDRDSGSAGYHGALNQRCGTHRTQ